MFEYTIGDGEKGGREIKKWERLVLNDYRVIYDSIC